VKRLEQYWFGPEEGMNYDIHPFLLGDKKAPYLRNVELRSDESLRWARCDISLGGPYATSYSPVFSLFARFDMTNQTYVPYVHAGNFVWYNASDDPYQFQWTMATHFSLAAVDTRWVVADGINIASGYSNSFFLLACAGLEPFTNVTYPNLLLWSCEDPAIYTVHSSYAPNWVTAYQGRLWITEPPTRLRWTNIDDGVTFDPSNYLEIDPGDGDKVVAVVPLRSIEPRLVIFKKRSIFLLDIVWSDGALIPTTENSIDTTNSAVKIMSKEIGCIAPKTIKYVTGSERADIFFLSDKGVFSVLRLEQDIGGGLSEPISQGIQEFIRRMTPSAAHKATAAVFDNKYYLALPIDGATENNAVFVFDLVRKRWEAILDRSVVEFLVNTIADEERLLGAMFDSTIASPQHTVTAPSGATLLSDCWPVLMIGALSGTTHVTLPGADYEFHVETPIFNLGVPSRVKRWDRVELYYHYEPVDNRPFVKLRYRTSRDGYTTGEWPLLTEFTLPAAGSALHMNIQTSNLADVRPSEYIQFKVKSENAQTFRLLGIRIVGSVQEDIWDR